MESNLVNHKIDMLERSRDDHEERIQDLEKADVKLFTSIDNLIKQMQEVTAWIKWFIISLILGFGGFFIWYIQGMGR